jgi:GAF domain-containing protein
MNFYHNLTINSLFIVALLSSYVAVYAFSRRRVTGAAPLAWLMVAVAFWTFCYALELQAQSTSQIIFWSQLEYISIALIPTILFLFTLTYTRGRLPVNRQQLILYFIEPCVIILLAWTIPYHRLIWVDYTPVSDGTGIFLQKAYGPAFWFHILYTYTLLMTSTFLVLSLVRSPSKLQRNQARVLFIGIVFPWLGNLASVFGLNPFPFLDLTPFTLLITGLAAAIGLFGFQLLEVLPIAQGTVMENMDDGLIVLDLQNRIKYINSSAARRLGGSPKEFTDRSAWDVFTAWPGLRRVVSRALSPDETSHPPAGDTSVPAAGSLESTLSSHVHEVACGEGDKQQYFEVRLTPLKDSQGSPAGALVTCANITDRKNTEVTLRKRLADLTVLHQVASSTIGITDEDELIAQITLIIGETLFPDHYGVLLLDQCSGALHFHPSYSGLPGEMLSTPIPPGKGITGWVAGSGEMRRVDDASQEPDFIFPQQRTSSELCVPLKIGEQVIGVINLESSRKAAFGESDERLLTILAGQMAATIERIRKHKAERQRVAELLTITRVSHEITSVLDRQKVLDSIANYAAEFSHADASGIFLQNENNRLYLVAAHGIAEHTIQKINKQGISAIGTVIGQALAERRPIQIPDIQQAEEYILQEIIEADKVRAIMALPLLNGNLVMGSLVLWHWTPRRFSTDEEHFLQALAQQSVNAAENARLFEAEREQRKLAEDLRETGSVLSATLNFDNVLDRLLEQVARLIPYDSACLMTIENGQAHIRRARGYEKYGERCLEDVLRLEFNISQTPNLRTMVETRKPMVIPDVSDSLGWLNGGATPYMHSWIGAPIVWQERVIGFFSLDHTERNFYKKEQAERLAIFSVQAGLALQNARLFEDTSRRLQEVSLLSKVITLTAAADDLEEAVHQVCTVVAQFFGASHVGYASLNASATLVEMIGAYPSPEIHKFQGKQSPVPPDLLDFLKMKRMEPTAFHDTPGDPLFEQACQFIHHRGVATIVLAPVLQGERILGIFGIDSAIRRMYSPNEISLLQNISSQVSQAIQRLKLFKDAQEHSRQMDRLAALSAQLNRTFTLDQVVQGIGEGVLSLSQADDAAIYIGRRDTTGGSFSEFDCLWTTGSPEEVLRKLHDLIVSTAKIPFSETSTAILIQDLLALPEDAPARQLASQGALRSISLWPLVYEGQIIAMASCSYHQPYSWTGDQQEVMSAFLRQAAVALQNARLFDETRRRAAQQEALNAIIAAAVTAPDLPGLVTTVLHQLLRALQADSGTVQISVINGVQGPTTIRFSLEVGQENLHSESLPTWVPLTPINQLDGSHPGNIRAMVQAAGIQIGLIDLVSFSPRVWLEEEITLVETVGQQLGSAVERFNLLAQTQEQARQVQLIIDTVPDGVLLLDPERHVLLANPAAQKYISVLVPDYDPSRPITTLAGQPIESLLQTYIDRAWYESALGVNPRYIFEIAARPLQPLPPGLPDGENEKLPTTWVLVLRDVTLERESQMRIQIQDRLATVGQLAAGIAHDFNNIMAAITVYADLLGMDPMITATGKERLGIIQQQIQRASSLIRQILDFSRRTPMEQSDVDLLPFIKEIDKLLIRILPENIRLELVYQSSSYWVHADPTRLQQVFMNLASNARDAMPEGGMLRFELSRSLVGPEDTPPVPGLSPGKWVVIQVSDTGTGIPEDLRPRIFDPFFTTKEVGHGTGLGLAQVYGIIDQHNGYVDFFSKVGEGTTFIICLPELESPTKAAAPVFQLPKLKGVGETVLVVEDDPAARDALQALLEAQNYHVISASDGEEGLARFKKHQAPIRLVISDMVMPSMGGLKLFQELRALSKQTRMLLITGHSLSESDLATLQELHVYWLQKPFSIIEITRAIQNLRDN